MDKVDNLAEVKKQCCHGGGEEKMQMQHNLDKLTARERILHLLDEGTFIEIGALLNNNGGGVIAGYGTIQGRLVYVYSQDYTVDGGALTKENCDKICRVMDMAAKMGAPIIQVFDSVGAKLSEGLDVLGAYGKILNRNAKLSGVIPQISVVAGPSIGIAALNSTMSDFTIMVEKSGELGISTSSKLIESEGRYIDKTVYSNAENCAKNGSIQMSAEDDKSAMKLVRQLLQYIPSNNAEGAPISEETNDLNIVNERFNEMVNNENCDTDEIINEISDNGSVISLNKEWAKSVVTDLVKINGLTVGVIGNRKSENPNVDMAVCDKITRFVRLCDSFNIPVLSIVNSKGFIVDLEQEQKGLSLYAGKILHALSGADIGKLALIVGEAYGASYLVFASKEASFDAVYSWPSAKISLGDPKALIKTLYHNEIVKEDDPKAAEEKVIEKYMAEVTDPYAAARKGYVDDIIMPSETKARVFAMLDMLQSKRELKYPKKHGSNLV